MTPFFTILTNYGKSALTEALAVQDKLKISYISLGDGGGGYYEPAEEQVSLRNELWSGELNDLYSDEDLQGQVIAEAVIPSGIDGDWIAREIGLFDAEGGLIAIGKYPETYIPPKDSGANTQVYIKMIVKVGNVAAVELKVNSDVVLASKQHVQMELSSLMRDFLKGDGSSIGVGDNLTLRDLRLKTDAFITLSQFGGDSTGRYTCDDALKKALIYSSENDVTLLLHGLVKLTKTVYQPEGSSVDGSNAIVFCEDVTYLDDATLWKADEPNSGSRKLEIIKLILSTSPSIKNYEDRLMKGLHVNTSRVNIGTVLTFGFQLGGVEIGSKGYEVTWDLFSCTIKAWTEDTRDVWGVKLTTTDNKGKTVITQSYPRGVSVAGSNHINTIHAWGFPATITNEYPNRQLLTGVSISNDSLVEYLYVDTPDTSAYDTPHNEKDGVCVFFPSRRATISNLFVRLHPQTKPEKVKLVKYDGPNNNIDNLKVQEQSKLTSTPLVYNLSHLRYQNRIDSSNVINRLNRVKYTDVVMTGLIAYTGSLVVTTVGRLVEISVFLDITIVDNSTFDVIKIELPDSLKLTQGYAGAVIQSSCISISSGNGGMYIYIDSDSKLRIGYTNAMSGIGSYITADKLKSGLIEFKFNALNAFEM